jgi:hypothetical protein
MSAGFSILDKADEMGDELGIDFNDFWVQALSRIRWPSLYTIIFPSSHRIPKDSPSSSTI